MTAQADRRQGRRRAAFAQRVAGAVARFRAATGRAPGPRGGAGRRGSGERGLCPLEGQGDASKRGWRASSTSLPRTITQDELLALVDQLNADPAVDGILVQLPLPAADRRAGGHRPAIDPDKDVDGFHPVNAGRLAIGLPRLRAVHAARLPDAAQAGARRPHRPRRGRRRPLEHRRQADGAAAAPARAAPSPSPIRAPATCPRVVRRADIVVAAVGRPEWSRATGSSPARR